MVEKIKRLNEKDPVNSEPQSIKRTKIRIVGIGGGAGNIVSELAGRIKKISFVAANTDQQALKQLRRNVLRFQFGENLTRGMGTGMDIDLARTAALNAKEKIKKLFHGYDFCILISTLGGGAGSGAAPVFAKEARNAGAITLGVFTLPFKFEGERRQELSREALQRLKQNLSVLIVLPNDRIFQIVEKSTPLKDALSLVNKNLADSLQGLIETLYLPGLINIDFADLKTVLHGQGKLAYLNNVEIHGANRAVEAIKNVLSNPLYPYSIKGARRILFNITGDRRLSLAEVSDISRAIFEHVFSNAKIIFGLSQDSSLRDTIKVCVLATGCTAKIFVDSEISSRREKPVKKKKKKSKQKLKLQPEQKIKGKVTSEIEPHARTKKVRIKVQQEKNESAVRKNALLIKEEIKEQEKEFLEKEKFWETPAFLRKQQE